MPAKHVCKLEQQPRTLVTAFKTDVHLTCSAIDLRHKRDLVRSLTEIILIDADLVDPYVDRRRRMSGGAYCGSRCRVDMEQGVIDQ